MTNTDLATAVAAILSGGGVGAFFRAIYNAVKDLSAATREQTLEIRAGREATLLALSDVSGRLIALQTRLDTALGMGGTFSAAEADTHPTLQPVGERRHR